MTGRRWRLKILEKKPLLGILDALCISVIADLIRNP